MSKHSSQPKEPRRKLVAGVDYVPLPPLDVKMSKEELAALFAGAPGAMAELAKMIERHDAKQKDGAA